MPPPLPREDLQHVVDHTRQLWGELRGQRLFITGGTGFFGCWLLETFAFANDELALQSQATVLTRDAAGFRKKAPHLASHPAVRLVEGDVRSFAFPEGEFSHVIHAATTSSAPVHSLEMLDTIVEGTRRVLDFAVACGARRFLLTSSGAVYGKQPPDLAQIPEEYSGAPDPADPNSAYGEGKRVAELLCAIYQREHAIQTTIARCFAFVGPHLPLDAHFAIGNFIRDAMAGGPIVVKNGAPFRSYLYAADLAVWLWTILFKGAAARPYNVGSDAAMTITQLARVVAEMFGVSTTESEPSVSATRYVPSTARAQTELGLAARIGLGEAIEKTAGWHRLAR